MSSDENLNIESKISLQYLRVKMPTIFIKVLDKVQFTLQIILQRRFRYLAKN